ncbi:metallophosphoesterase family protein [uncultured Flavobacterium sp.]|uniref:metallophosphoesterase family protein n=1 Tax=uncultured Flavobacterium sp. TaxID=165435 RepID=UPI0025E91F12|nr:metallophosphoesterase family protein [uncultured Flavobacterium sp.]
MKIAVISDIHANLPALAETLKSIEEHDIDVVYCLGDLVGYNVWPNAVISEMRKRKIPTIAGNHDEKAVKVHQDSKGQFNDDEYSYNIIDKEHIPYLCSLPANIRLSFKTGADTVNLLMVHGSPYSNREYLHHDKEESEFVTLFQECSIDMLIFGHTHKPYHRVITDKQSGRSYHAINAGSVGKPKDNDPRGCYTIIQINIHEKFNIREDIKVAFVRVLYDVEKAARAIENSPLPHAYATMLRKAY